MALRHLTLHLLSSHVVFQLKFVLFAGSTYSLPYRDGIILAQYHCHGWRSQASRRSSNEILQPFL